MNLISNTIYEVKDFDSIVSKLEPDYIKTSKGISYLNKPIAFDIESSSFYEDGEKRAIMYAWVLGIDGQTIIGRTWKDAIDLIDKLSSKLHLNNDRRIIIYVHNLSYEFQFIQHYFKWDSVFALDTRKVAKAITTNGIEFRCSYILSGYSLAYIGSNVLTTYHVEKMTGDLDYELIRHSQTPLTEKELRYIQHDGLVVMAYIQERIEQDGNITRIPLTKTGYVRKYCRNACLYGGGGTHKDKSKYYSAYRRVMNSLKITSVQEYHQLKRAFQGGFTHANALWSGNTINDVTSYDFTSSYPSVMIAEMFPMSSAKLVTIHSKEELQHYLHYYCCIFDITFIGLDSITTADHPLSSSKCFKSSGVVIDNGRIVSADEVSTTITNIDYDVYLKFYSWQHCKIKNFRIYKKGYLPREFVLSILQLYHDKTTLKGVDGEDTAYMHSKENLNSCYGMCVTDICRPEINFNQDNGEWTTTACDESTQLQKYNESKSRFLFYPWGIFVTAYARRNLFTGIYALGSDYIYADTDSIKGANMDAHLNYINAYNEQVKTKLLKAMKYQNIDDTFVHPKTIKGVEKWLGVWDFDGHYKQFKTLGAKRYMVKYDDDKLSLTISGVNKKVAMPYLIKTYGDKVFDNFKEDLAIGGDYTGKNIHTYLDYSQHGYVTDYLGNKAEYYELSSIHMEKASYTLSLSNDYIEYLMGVHDENK